MTLSNTDTPKYYAKWREKVLNGEVQVCEEIKMEMDQPNHHLFYIPNEDEDQL